jgi:hypothetical protein
MINLEGLTGLKFAEKVKLTQEKKKEPSVCATGCFFIPVNYLKAILNKKGDIKEIKINDYSKGDIEETLLFREVKVDETVVKASEYYNEWHIKKDSPLGKIIAGVSEIIEQNRPEDDYGEDD